jgi:hypothetical protein
MHEREKLADLSWEVLAEMGRQLRPRPRGAELLRLFMLDGTVGQRLEVESQAKAALGAVCHELLARGGFRRPMIEAGATHALAWRACIQKWAA